VAIAAVALGACVIEKHFTISRSDKGIDGKFSLEPQEFRFLVKEALCAWKSLGRVRYGPTGEERKSLVFRRSIYAVKDIAAGEVITRSNIRIIRPGLGLAPKYYDRIIGRKINRNVKRGTPFSLAMLK
jgi:sialic acid synthase SpsE